MQAKRDGRNSAQYAPGLWDPPRPEHLAKHRRIQNRLRRDVEGATNISQNGTPICVADV
jgi:hypothetical protein